MAGSCAEYSPLRRALFPSTVCAPVVSSVPLCRQLRAPVVSSVPLWSAPCPCRQFTGDSGKMAQDPTSFFSDEEEGQLEHHWRITGASLEHHWDITGASLGHHWGITGASLEHHWGITGASLGHHWSITGASLGHHWSITGASLEHHWGITGASLEHRERGSPGASSLLQA
ncbi:hypothetical protein ACOMHN_022890 [Nucella lapillus]